MMWKKWRQIHFLTGNGIRTSHGVVNNLRPFLKTLSELQLIGFRSIWPGHCSGKSGNKQEMTAKSSSKNQSINQSINRECDVDCRKLSSQAINQSIESVIHKLGYDTDQCVRINQSSTAGNVKPPQSENLSKLTKKQVWNDLIAQDYHIRLLPRFPCTK